jgi:hypothetical protein
MRVNEELLYSLYMEWVNHVAEECDWVTSFGPEFIIGSVCRIIEENPHIITQDPDSPNL